MSSREKDGFLEAGIDYITATTTAKRGEASLDAFGAHLVDAEIAAGSQGRTYRAEGYFGRHAGSAAYGRRPDGALVRLSGALAGEHWAQVVQLASNVSRLDLQVTILPTEGATQRLARHVSEANAWWLKHPTRHKPKVHSSPLGPETLNLGSRKSDRCARIYDKGLQSKDPFYSGSLRYEAELHNKLAFHMAQQVDAVEFQAAYIAEYVYSFVSVCNLQVPRREGVYQLINERPAGRPRDRSIVLRDLQRAHWLTNCVRPSVEGMIARGGLETVLVALGLDQLVLIRSRAEMAQLAH